MFITVSMAFAMMADKSRGSKMFICYIPWIYCIILMAVLVPILCHRFKSPNKIKHKKIAILIPTYNDSSTIVSVLESIKMQKHDHELIVFVLNDGSTDDTLRKVSIWCDKLDNYNVISSAINSGRKGFALEYAKEYLTEYYDVIVCIDADTILHPSAISNGVNKLYSEDNIAAGSGCVIPWRETKRSLVLTAQKCELEGTFHAIKFVQSHFGSINTLAGALSIYRRESLDKVGWFSDWLVEDICWTWKACALGMQVKYAEDAIGWTLCPSNYSQYFKQRRRWARGRIEALKSVAKLSDAFCVLPWFIFSFMQFLLLPSFLFLLIIDPYAILILFFLLTILHCFYSRFTSVNLKAMTGQSTCFVYSGIVTSLFIEVLMFIPNILGMLDEVFCKEKKWLTR